LSRFFALFLAVASVDALLLGIFNVFVVSFVNANDGFKAAGFVFVFCCLLIGSFIGLVSGIYFRGGGGFRRSILVFLFVVFIIADLVVVCLMHEVWSGIPFSFVPTAFYTNTIIERNGMLLFKYGVEQTARPKK
jgi:hypothetical protein